MGGILGKEFAFISALSGGFGIAGKLCVDRVLGLCKEIVIGDGGKSFNVP